jgi:hypothetical protein
MRGSKGKSRSVVCCYCCCLLLLLLRIASTVIMFLQMKHIIYGFTIALCIAALLALAQTEVRFNN